MNEDEIVNIAVEGTKMVKECAKDFPGKIILEYSPESFTGTELPFALRICTEVQKTWGATKRESDHHQSAVHRRNEHAKCVCGSDRMDEPAF